MSGIALEILLILLLLAANGVFAMTEIAVVSARKTRLRRLAEGGDLKAKAALALAASPNRFLATVQIGITMVGVLAGAFGGATIAEQIAAALESVPVLAPYGEAIGLALVVLAITFCSLILGELVPKRIGLHNPERIARLMAGPMDMLSRLASPLVRLLGATTDLVLRLVRLGKPADAAVSDEDVKDLIREGVRAGVFDRREPAMVEGVLALDQLPVSAIMTPRAQIIWLNQNTPHEVLWHKIVVSGHSCFPVYEQARERVVGVVALKAIYANLAAGIPARVGDLMVPPLFIEGTRTVATALELFKRTGQHLALVTDNTGQVSGLVSVLDVMEAIVGEFPDASARLKPQARKRPDGSWLVDGSLPLETLEPLVDRLHFPHSDRRDSPTLAEYAARRLGRAPQEGDTFTEQGCHFEILDLDGPRVDKVLIAPLGSGSPLLPSTRPQP